MKYEVFGPNATGEYIVGYRTPGCGTITCAIPCRTLDQANAACKEANDAFRQREEEVRLDQELRGFISRTNQPTI
jgi:hypothetical protein